MTATPQPSVVLEPGALLLSEPYTDAQRLHFLPPNTLVTVHEESRGYCRVHAQGQVGFVLAASICPLDTPIPSSDSRAQSPDLRLRRPGHPHHFNQRDAEIKQIFGQPWYKAVILGASVVAILSTFLPWVRITSGLAGSITLNLWSSRGVVFDGLAITGSAAVATLQLWGLMPWKAWGRWEALTSGLLIAGLATWHLLSEETLENEFVRRTYGEGNYLALAAGIALIAAGWKWATSKEGRHST